jgi:hypothetical protein
MNRLLWGNVLKRWWKSCLGLPLALAVSSASAADVEWHAASDARPAATAPAAPRGPAVTIGAPVPLAPSAAPAPVRPVSFTNAADSGAPVVFRAQMADNPRMMPAGLPDGPNDPPKKSNLVLPAPKPLAVPPPPDPCAATYSPCIGGAPACANPDGCGPFCANDCCGVPRDRWWVRGEYLMWWLKGQGLPALVTTGSPSDAVPGALGQPHTAVLFGDSTVGDGMRSGGRFTFGWWCDDEHTIGVDGSFFFLAPRSVQFFAGSNGTPALFRPFFNPGFAFNVTTGGFVPVPPLEDAEEVAFPGVLAGNVAVRLKTELWGYDLNLRTNVLNGCYCGCGYTLDGYVGFRGLGLDETLGITENLTSLLPAAPGSIFVQDRFQTHNRFYGGQIGFETELRRGRWFLDLNTKVALGDTRQTVNIAGQTVTTDAFGGLITSRGGLLALTTNAGNYSRDRFAVMPEVTLNVGYQVTDWMRLFVGYNFLYLSNVARAGDQINRTVNPTGIPLNGSTLQGAAQPSFTFHSTDFYAQGVNFGLEFRW